MSKELKDFIDSVDSANKAQSDLEITIRGLKEDVQRLNFTIDEQKRIIEDQKSKLSSVQNDNTPEDISVLKELVTQQRQNIIKKDKDVEILQLTIAEITEELENVQKFEEENEELIYANKEIVQLTEEKGINRVQIEASKLEIENLIKQNQENEALKNQVSLELVETNKILDINSGYIHDKKQSYFCTRTVRFM